MGSHEQVWVSTSNWPWPEQSGRHWRASLSVSLQSTPFQPFLHKQTPSAQNPCPVQVGWGQSTEMKTNEKTIETLLVIFIGEEKINSHQKNYDKEDEMMKGLKVWNKYLTFFTEFPFESSCTHAFPIGTLTMTITIWDFALIMAQAALFSFPTWVTLAFTVDIITTLTA